MLKGHESQLKLAQDGNKALYEEKQRFLIEIKKLKEELKQALDSNADIEAKLLLVSDAAKNISVLRDRIESHEQTISDLKTTIGDLKG